MMMVRHEPQRDVDVQQVKLTVPQLILVCGGMGSILVSVGILIAQLHAAIKLGDEHSVAIAKLTSDVHDLSVQVARIEGPGSRTTGDRVSESSGGTNSKGIFP